MSAKAVWDDAKSVGPIRQALRNDPIFTNFVRIVGQTIVKIKLTDLDSKSEKKEDILEATVNEQINVFARDLNNIIDLSRVPEDEIDEHLNTRLNLSAIEKTDAKTICALIKSASISAKMCISDRDEIEIIEDYYSKQFPKTMGIFNAITKGGKSAREKTLCELTGMNDLFDDLHNFTKTIAVGSDELPMFKKGNLDGYKLSGGFGGLDKSDSFSLGSTNSLGSVKSDDLKKPKKSFLRKLKFGGKKKKKDEEYEELEVDSTSFFSPKRTSEVDLFADDRNLFSESDKFVKEKQKLKRDEFDVKSARASQSRFGFMRKRNERKLKKEIEEEYFSRFKEPSVTPEEVEKEIAQLELQKEGQLKQWRKFNKLKEDGYVDTGQPKVEGKYPKVDKKAVNRGLESTRKAYWALDAKIKRLTQLAEQKRKALSELAIIEKETRTRPTKQVPAKKGGKKKKRGNEQDLFGDSFDDYFNEEG
jgi:hypothetical protein